MPSSRSSSRREMVVLPAPLGLDRTKRSPRRSSGLWVAMRATGLRPPAPSSRVAPMTRFVALLRAVNVGGRALPMAALRALCEAELGWGEVATYIQSGNVVFAAKGKAEALEAALEQAIEAKFSFEVPVMVRTASEWHALLAANPFPKEAEAEPNRVFLGVPKRPPAADAADRIAAKAAAGERAEAAGAALWFHYPQGAGASKLTPALIDRAAGCPVTARNWRTATKLAEMLT